ncbi:hypothetical protein PsYK624_137380 [Phanerochaete sordida]|uniref:Uncharacterized protein n=1 Tax=Phanerochaete sordida TaxID=48140 RepID=A0A9P3GLH0_9APHY|nr:hypothetical protein PsYK624_137380 [Phanerochaete sordida]
MRGWIDHTRHLPGRPLSWDSFVRGLLDGLHHKALLPVRGVARSISRARPDLAVISSAHLSHRP